MASPAFVRALGQFHALANVDSDQRFECAKSIYQCVMLYIEIKEDDEEWDLIPWKKLASHVNNSIMPNAHLLNGEGARNMATWLVQKGDEVIEETLSVWDNQLEEMERAEKEAKIEFMFSESDSDSTKTVT